MSEQEATANGQLRTSDPAMMRALAHPLRIEIMEQLLELGEATATEIAARLGETPANCSFHLRTLAKAGYIERGEQRGTAKPWRAKYRGHDLRPDPSDPVSVRTSSALAVTYIQYETARVLDYFSSVVEDPAWVPGTSVNSAGFWATAEELEELAAKLAEITEPFKGRVTDPSLRPAGARKAHLFATLNPEPPSRTAGAGSPHRPS